MLTGVSAGSVCWFTSGTTGSFGLPLREVRNGLGSPPEVPWVKWLTETSILLRARASAQSFGILQLRRAARELLREGAASTACQASTRYTRRYSPVFFLIVASSSFHDASNFATPSSSRTWTTSS
jgi:hypothetical protein